MSSPNLKEVSRVVSRALRHSPDAYGLTLDQQGWVSVSDLLTALAKNRHEWAGLSEKDLANMIETSAKTRHELRNGKIRALYGHSVPEKVEHAPTQPPDSLYHGTHPNVVQKILAEGLKRMGRQYVHLSADLATAMQVGQRKSSHPALFSIAAAQAFTAGIRFYRGNNLVWLADEVPPNFLSLVND